MRTRMWKAAGPPIVLALGVLVIAGCGSSGDDTTTTAPPAVSRGTADHLAKLSNRVASNLDAGETCSAAIAADELKAAVDDSDLPASLRPGVETVATDLVNQVNCPPPPPPPEPEKKPKKPKEDKGDEQGNGDEHGNGNGNGHGNGHDEHESKGHGKHGGFVPPGDATLKGEEG